MGDEPERAQEWSAAEKAAYRRFVRTNHPDLGGDPEVFISGMQQFTTDDPGPPAAGNAQERYDAPVIFVAHRHGLRATAEAFLRRVRRRHRRRHRRVR